MAIFGKKKAAQDTAEDTHTSAPVSHATVDAPASVIIRPHITEKAFAASQRNVYTFQVRSGANKHEIAAAIKSIYNVTPRKVNIVKKRPRVVRSLMRSKPMHQSGLSKAYVYLKEGDTINFM